MRWSDIWSCDRCSNGTFQESVCVVAVSARTAICWNCGVSDFLWVRSAVLLIPQRFHPFFFILFYFFSVWSSSPQGLTRRSRRHWNILAWLLIWRAVKCEKSSWPWEPGPLSNWSCVVCFFLSWFLLLTWNSVHPEFMQASLCMLFPTLAPLRWGRWTSALVFIILVFFYDLHACFGCSSPKMLLLRGEIVRTDDRRVRMKAAPGWTSNGAKHSCPCLVRCHCDMATRTHE